MEKQSELQRPNLELLGSLWVTAPHMALGDLIRMWQEEQQKAGLPVATFRADRTVWNRYTKQYLAEFPDGTVYIVRFVSLCESKNFEYQQTSKERMKIAI